MSMIQIDMEMPKFCWWMDGDDYRKCPMVDGKNGCCLHSNVCYATWEEQYKHCPLHEVTDTDTVSRKPETTTEIQKILDYLDNELHPLVSPDNWNVYSELYDMVSELENLPPSPTVTSDPDTVSRQAIRDAIRKLPLISVNGISSVFYKVDDINRVIDDLPPSPSRQAEPQTNCDYCHEDSDGYVTPIEKNNHAFVRFGMDGWELSLKANGWHGEARIKFCPMCGRRLADD